MPSPPSYIMPAFLFHPDPKTAGPLPSPISIPAVPASLYLLYFSILLAYAAAFVPPQHTSLLLLRGRPCIPLSRKFPFFFPFNRPPGVLHCFLSSPYCPALYSPVMKVSLLFSFQPSPRCAPFFLLPCAVRSCVSPSRKFLCFFLFNRLLGVLHFFFSPVLSGLVFPRHESFFVFFFSTVSSVCSIFSSFLCCPVLYFPVMKVSLLLSFQRKKGTSLRGTPFSHFFFLISWPDR